MESSNSLFYYLDKIPLLCYNAYNFIWEGMFLAFMSLALSFIAELSLEELLDLFSESSLGALIILTVFLVIPRHILGIVLLVRGCSARSREGRTTHAIALQCTGVILLLPIVDLIFFIFFI